MKRVNGGERGKSNFVKLFLFIFALMFFSSMISAVYCTPSYVSTSYEYGAGYSINLSCTNNLNSSVGIIKTGSYFFINKNSISASSTENVQVSLQADAPVGTHTGEISFSDSSSVVPVLFSVFSSTSSSGILVFPTSKVVSVKQGEEKTQNILVTIPSTYSGSITIQSVDFNPGTETIRFGDLNLGVVSPGSTIQIPIVFSGVDASIGTYQTNLNIFAINSSGQIPLPTINLQLQVIQGISPTTNFSLSELPTCSLSATEMNLNQTYSFICSRNNPNIAITPIIDNFYLVGVDVQDSSSQYTYKFKAKKIGNTEFTAQFSYQGSPVGDLFQQSIRISPSGSSPVPGTLLDFIFYQNSKNVPFGNVTGGNVTILVIDNSTRNYVAEYTLLLDGVAVNNTFDLISNKDYELRASSPGYLDKVINFTTQKIQLTISLDPVKETYMVGEIINITSNAGDVSYILNDFVITSPYTFLAPGNFVLKAEKQDYISAEMNITVEGSLTYKSLTPSDTSTWKKGTNVSIELNEAMDWVVEFRKQISKGDFEEQGTLIYSGSGETASFMLDEYGIYDVKSINGQMILSQAYTKSGSKFWEWVKSHKVIVFSIIGVLIVAVLTIIFISKRPSNEEIPMSSSSGAEEFSSSVS